MSRTVEELGEEAIVSRIREMLPGGETVVVGPGDDCAVIDNGGEELELLKTDCLIEGVHFLPETGPERVGRKAINRVLSDMAAMGGRPRHALVTLACGAEKTLSEIEGWYRGMIEAATRHECVIVGGETAKLKERGAWISIAMTGTVPRRGCIRRSGASMGEKIFVTGKLGASFPSGRHLTFTPRIEEALWLAEHSLPTSMMDLSDGLGSDLPRLLAESGLGYEIDPEQIPRHDEASIENAISDGEDYELLFTAKEVSPEKWQERFPETPLTEIGTVTTETANPLSRGWEHFS